MEFDYNYAHLLNEMTLEVILIFWKSNDYYSEVSDIQIVILVGHLEDEMARRV
jgi:hypothetical protein